MVQHLFTLLGRPFGQVVTLLPVSSSTDLFFLKIDQLDRYPQKETARNKTASHQGVRMLYSHPGMIAHDSFVAGLGAKMKTGREAVSMHSKHGNIDIEVHFCGVCENE